MRPRLLSLAAFSLTAVAVTLLPLATAGDLYKWTDEKGQVHYTSTPPPDNAKKAATIDSKKLNSINALPNDPHKNRADESEPADDSGPSQWAPTQTTSSNAKESAPASPPTLIPPSLLPPSNPPATAKPEQTAQPEIVEVVAQGMGIDANSALLNAYSNAVQQALGLYVDAETLVQNDEIVRDKILTYSKGFIQEATKVKESQANGLFQVNIRAKVKRQQLLEQAKANNITVKAVEGVSLHAQVESQLKQEQDAKALLKKALLPLTETTFHRAELVPSTQEQPNPIINKKGTDDNFVTLDYKVDLWIDEQEYLKYLNSSLIPIINQIATDKKTGITIKIDQDGRKGIPSEVWDNYSNMGEKAGDIFVMYWKDKGMTISKWNKYSIPKDIAAFFEKEKDISKNDNNLVIIELSLLDETGKTISIGDKKVGDDSNKRVGDDDPMSNKERAFCRTINPVFSTCDFYIAAVNTTRATQVLFISPYFSESHAPSYGGIRRSVLSKIQTTISIKIAKKDLPSVKSANLEVKPVRGK